MLAKGLLDWDKRRTWYWAIALLALLGAGWIAVSRADQETQRGDVTPARLPKEGYLAPEWALQSLDGEEVTLSGLRGQVVILNFWATWCPPCRSEMPAIEEIHRAYRDQGLAVVAVNVQQAEGQIQAFVDEMGLTFPVLPDSYGSVSKRYLIKSLPTTFIIERTGTIREIVVGGPLARAYLASAVEPLLKDEGGE
jgi:cytochrome c biogenesis protein CcmG/thiol:disulfide interchange protein DsbE